MSKKTTILFALLVGYVLAAGGWWSYLLIIKNRDAWQAKALVLRYELESKGVFDQAVFENSAAYIELTEKYSRQELMIYGEGAALGFLLLLGIWQIHESRKKEDALKLQQQNFLLSITHELKSPLASIQLSLQTFLRHELPREKVEKISTHALRETQRLHKHVETMLLAARLEGGYAYQFEEADLVELCQNCIAQAQPKYKGKISFAYPQTENIVIQADKFALAMAVNNLLENAIAYAPNTEKIEVQLSREKQRFCLSVADFGQGIPIRERAKIFDKFYRIGDENTRSSKGTGLGLYIVQKCLQAHKGSITVSDNQPQGTVFSLVLG